MLPKKVVLFYKELLGPGGAERQYLEEYKYLRSKGVAVKALTFEAREEALFGHSVHDIEVIRPRNPAAAIWCLRRNIREFAPEVVSVHSGHIDIYLATRGLRIPFIYHHNSPVLLHSGSEEKTPYSLFHKRALERILEATPWAKNTIRTRRVFTTRERLLLELRALFNLMAMRAAKEIIVLSRQTAWEVKQMYGKETVCIRGALDPRILEYAPNHDPKNQLGLNGHRIILSISRLSAEKRVELLMHAFDKIASDLQDVVFLIGGCGPDEGRLKALGASLKHGARIRFCGFIEEEKLWDYYGACDLFATPAWADFDIAPYEALALGRKVVWSSEMETESQLLRSGLIFEADPTVEDFARSLKVALMAHPTAKPDLTEYTWPRKFERIYELLAP